MSEAQGPYETVQGDDTPEGAVLPPTHAEDEDELDTEEHLQPSEDTTGVGSTTESHQEVEEETTTEEG